METNHQLKDVKLGDITVSKTNPRKHFDQDSILELAESIREKGVIQPIVLRPKAGGNTFELVCGERRYRACVMVKGAIKTRDTIPAIIRELNDEEVLQLQIIENLQRKDVHPMDEAVAFKSLMAIKGFDVAEIAKRIGKGPAYVAQRLKLNDLIDEFQKAFYQNRMNLTDTLKVCRISTADQKELWEEESFGDSGEIELDSWTLKKYHRNLNDAPFDTKDPSLNKVMGACGGCPFNSAANALLFPDSAHNAICTNGQCYHGKADTSFKKLFDEAKEDPAIVLVTTEYNSGKITKDLIAKGITVLEKYKGYEVAAEKPEMPEREDDEDETKEYNDKQWEQEMYDYKSDLEQYNAEVASGKLLKAFVVEGDNRGKYIYVTLKKGASTAAGSSTAVKAKQAEGTISAEDIRAEIERINEREIRSKELDEEKKQPLLYAALTKCKIEKVTGQLALAEKRGLLLLLADYGGYEGRDPLYKAIGCKNESDYNLVRIYQFAATATEKKLDECLNIAVRVLLLNKLSPSQHSRPAKNGKAAMLVDMVKHYDKPAADTIEMAALEVTGKREAKVDSRLKGLKQQLKELSTKKETTTKPVAKKKTSK